MQLQIIKTEENYVNSLNYLSSLMDKNPASGTADADKLEVLAVLIEQYEKENFPIDIPDPVEAIRFRMDQQGLKNRDLVPCIGSISRVSEVLNHRRPLSLSMVRSLHAKLGIPAHVLLQEPEKIIPEDIGIEWTNFPLKDMFKNGYFPSFLGTVKDLAEHAEDLVSGFLGSVDEPALAAVRFRHAADDGTHKRSNRSMNQYALWAWCTRVTQKAKNNGMPKAYKSGIVTTEFMRKLARKSWSATGPQLAREYLNQHGIHLIIEPHLPKTYLDGASFILGDGHPVVAMSIRYDRIDNFWFVLMHELSHIAMHLDGKQDIFLDDLDSTSDAKEENEADELAGEVLLPKNVFEFSDAFSQKDVNSVMELADELEIHPAIIVGRLQKETGNYRLLNRAIGRGQGEVRKQFK